MMGDGATVSTSPLEWRSRVRAIAQARPVVFAARDMGRGILLLRQQLLRAVASVRRRVKGRVELGRRDAG